MKHANYEVFAVKYGEMAGRTRADNFLKPTDDDHDVPMPLDYFVWVIRNDDRTILVDTGFDPAEARRRGRQVKASPVEVLKKIGIQAPDVKDIVVTHMHYDHAGTLGDFPAARFYVQEAEMAYCTGPSMCTPSERIPFTPSHINDMIEMVFNDRVSFVNGDDEIAPGVSLHAVPGHTAGMQCVSVNTGRGKIVLASDAAHFYENYQKHNPFFICWSLDDMIKSFDRIGDIAESEHHIIPGHDPLVNAIYPALHSDLQGIVHRLDVAPSNNGQS